MRPRQVTITLPLYAQLTSELDVLAVAHRRIDDIARALEVDPGLITSGGRAPHRRVLLARRLAAYTLYRFETNVRSATVLGIVGAGGIGHSLYENIRSFQYAETAAIIIIVILTVTLIDLLSARIRHVLV